MGKYNSWARNALLKMGKRASKSPITEIGKRIRSTLSGPIKSFQLENKIRKIMSDKQWVAGSIGSESYDTIFKKLKNLYENNDTSGIATYMQEQEEKMRNQQ